MNLSDPKYSKYALVKEMLETSDVVLKFDHSVSEKFAKRLGDKKALFLTGEGSSRIFPAKRAIYDVLKAGGPVSIMTEGATQAMEYKLKDYAVFGASNSGKPCDKFIALCFLAKAPITVKMVVPTWGSLEMCCIFLILLAVNLHNKSLLYIFDNILNFTL